MNKRRRLPALLLALALGSLPSSALAADISEITADDYYGAAYFKQALEHPKVQKKKGHKRQLKAVARDMRWKTKKLQAAIDKVESLDGDAIELAKTAIKAAFETTRVKGRVLDVLINYEEPKHIVLYVRWKGSSARDVVKEASSIAAAAAKAAPLISTLSLSAIHPQSPETSKESVWSGKIGRASMERISERRINDYADRLYKPLFEGVEEKPF